jgi:ubiquinone/menaquinone biosynthesis C-methylase UbiE
VLIAKKLVQRGAMVKKKISQSDINRHYSEISGEVGTSWSSTMLDKEIREKEIDNLISLIYKLKFESEVSPLKVLDVGCGNGYVAARLKCEFPFLIIDGIDINSEMIKTANSRSLTNARFFKAPAMDLDTIEIQSNTYDLVFSTRCFINITDERARYKSIEIASKYVRAGGFFVLMEGFEDGQAAYNLLRTALGFQSIPPAWHNVYLDPEVIVNLLENQFDYLSESQMELFDLDRHFLSNRYLAMRVLLPLFKDDPDFFKNNRNDPHGLALSYLLPKTSGYSPLQLHLWTKR